jgi:hypothetical protein
MKRQMNAAVFETYPYAGGYKNFFRHLKGGYQKKNQESVGVKIF